MDINKDSKAKSSVKMNLGLGSKQKSPGSLQDQLERLQRELEDAHGLVYCLRAEIDQKEQIAKLALSGSKVSSHGWSEHRVICRELFAIPALHLTKHTQPPTVGVSLLGLSGLLSACSKSF